MIRDEKNETSIYNSNLYILLKLLILLLNKDLCKAIEDIESGDNELLKNNKIIYHTLYWDKNHYLSVHKNLMR